MATKQRQKRRIDEPAQSEATLLLKVEDLINIAMGPPDQNVVNFKLVQTILYILARNMRLLETKVELRVGELQEEAKHLQSRFGETSDEGSMDYDRSTEVWGRPGTQQGEEQTKDGKRKEKDNSRGAGGAEGAREAENEGGSETGIGTGTGTGGRSKKTGKTRDQGRPESAAITTAYDDDDTQSIMSKGGKTRKRGPEAGHGPEGGGMGARGGPGRHDDRAVDQRVSGTSIAISEKGHGKDKVLIVGKGAPGTASGAPTRVGSIEVVTAQEFAALETAVKALMEKASLPPAPKLPENKKLREDIAKGSASLTDTMQAMQLSARVLAAEKGIGNMADLLSQLAATGSLPPDIVQKAAAIQGEVQAMWQDLAAMGGPGGPGGGPGGPVGTWVGVPGGGPGLGPGGSGGTWVGGPGGGPGGGLAGPGSTWVGGPGRGPGVGPGGSGGTWVGGPGGGPGVGPGGSGGTWVGGPGGGPGVGPGGSGGTWVGGPGGGPGVGQEGLGGGWAGGPRGGPVGPDGAWAGGPGAPGDGFAGGQGGQGGPGGPWAGGPGGQFGQDGFLEGGAAGLSGPAGLRATGPGAISQALGRSLEPKALPAANLAPITHADLDGAMAYLRNEVVKSMQEMTQKASSTADAAAASVRTILEKMDTVSKLNNRISSLQEMVNDYADQLQGFDTGLTTQMENFQEQMVTLRAELQNGLTQLEQVNNNAETAAVLELTERYEGLVAELDGTLAAHQCLMTFQRHLGEELNELKEAVEQLREQKADRDEVLDGLRDKADTKRLEGLMSESDFEIAREELEQRILMCYEKFRRQEEVWMRVMNDFNETIETKAELSQLMSTREEAQDKLQDLHWKVQQLAKLLGDPKAAIITRKLAKDATCALCRVPALMEPVEPVHPISLDFARPGPEPAGAPVELDTKEPCLRTFNLKEILGPEPPRDEMHMCQRWVGGSHTMIGHHDQRGHVVREEASSKVSARPVKHYYGQGVDGKMYNLEEDLQPCVECNRVLKKESSMQLRKSKSSQGQLRSHATLVSAQKITSQRAMASRQKIPGEISTAQEGAGDQGAAVSKVTLVDPVTSARHVTVVEEKDLVDADKTAQEADAKPEPSSVGLPKSSSLAAMAEGGDDHVPTLQSRTDSISHASMLAIKDAASRDVHIGQTIHGHVTAVDEEANKIAEIKQHIAEDKDARGKADGAEGGGDGATPPPEEPAPEAPAEG